MIYTSKLVDAQLLSYSRGLVREALMLLRQSDHIVHAQRVRDELANPEKTAPCLE